MHNKNKLILSECLSRTLNLFFIYILILYINPSFFWHNCGKQNWYS